MKFAGIVAGIVSALTLSVGTAMAGSTDFQALKNLGSSTLTPMTQTELNGVVGANYDKDYDYDYDHDYCNYKCDDDKYDDHRGHHGKHGHHHGRRGHHHGRHGHDHGKRGHHHRRHYDNGYGKY